MKVAVLKALEKFEFEEREDPRPKPEEVVVRMRYAGISGTDIRIYKGRLKARLPMVLGQELVGEVEEVGGNVRQFSEGDIVVVEPVIRCGRCEYCLTGRYNLCNELKVLGVTTDGGFSEKLVVPEQTLHAIPEELDVKTGVLINPFSVGFHAVRKARATLGEQVVVLGGGPIGLSASLFATMQGAEVVLIEPNEFRRRIAEKYFDVRAMSPELADELSDSADVVIEASGSSEAISTAVKIVKKGGRIAVAGAYSQDSSLNFSLVVRKDVEILGVWLYPNIFGRVIDVLKERKVDVKQLITHEFKFEEIAKAFETASNGEVFKVVIRF